MDSTSRTGLLASPTKKIYKPKLKATPALEASAGPAPYTFKPFAGLYNPYASTCSLLCNHPAVSGAGTGAHKATGDDDDGYRYRRHCKQLLRDARDGWYAAGRKAVLLADEVTAIRASLLEQVAGGSSGTYNYSRHQRELADKYNDDFIPIESVPEELFRRYTESDSRPLTPAPTMASFNTRRSSTRKCKTPEPSEIREKTLLVLDLRRSHSQETLTCFGSTPQLLEPPLIRVTKVPTRTCSLENLTITPPCPEFGRRSRNVAGRNLQTSLGIAPRRPNSKHGKLDQTKQNNIENTTKVEQDTARHDEKKGSDDDEDDATLKRRGKRRRKRGRDSSRGPPAFQSSIDPETLVATIDPDSHNPSARTSLVPNLTEGTSQSNELRSASEGRHNSINVDSYISFEFLRQLRRELNEQIVDSEFNIQRRRALQEALKTVQKQKVSCAELKAIQKELNLPIVDTDVWMILPREFNRASARFELPMDSRLFKNLTPLEYVTEYVFISSTRKMLYNVVFNRNKIMYEEDDDEYHERRISGKNIPHALGEMMGCPLTSDQLKSFNDLIGWKEDDVFNFQTFCGLSALCERLLAREFYSQLPTRQLDPCQVIETADFESLTRRLHGLAVDERIVKILYGIKES